MSSDIGSVTDPKSGQGQCTLTEVIAKIKTGI